jgi:hypothetical protein
MGGGGMPFRTLLEPRMELEEISNAKPLEASPNYYFLRVY